VNPVIDTDSCWLVGWLSLHWKLNTLGWLRRFVPMVWAEFCRMFSCAWVRVPLTCQASQHWKPPLTRMPAASICSNQSAGMMWPSSLIALTPMFFMMAICLAVSAAE
jgi:hypothetical protein